MAWSDGRIAVRLLFVLSVGAGCRGVPDQPAAHLWLPPMATTDHGVHSYADGTGDLPFVAEVPDAEQVSEAIARHFESNGWVPMPVTPDGRPATRRWANSSGDAWVLVLPGQAVPGTNDEREWIGAWSNPSHVVVVYRLRAAVLPGRISVLGYAFAKRK